MKKWIVLLLAVFVLIPTLWCHADSRKTQNSSKKPVKAISGYVIGIKSCNEIAIRRDDEKVSIIFIVGIAGMSESDPMFEVCRQNLSKLIANKKVLVKILGAYDDTLIFGQVMLGKTDVAQKMLSAGWGIYNTEGKKMKAYEQATESAHQKERGYFAPEEEKEEWIREAVPIPYDENYHLIIDSKGITHNFTCEERNFGKKFMVSYEPTRKQCESCKGYDYWVEKYRPEHERRLRENLQPIVHGEKLLPDRVKEHILLSTDKMEGMEWYSSNRVKLRGRSSSTVYRDGDAIFVVEPYFGKDLATGKILFRMRTRYEDFRDRNYDSEWIFYERVQLLGVENDARLNIVPGSQKESNVADSGLQEWSDNLIDAEDFENLMKSKTIRVKFYGKYSREFDLTREQFLMFEEINYIYQKVK